MARSGERSERFFDSGQRLPSKMVGALPGCDRSNEVFDDDRALRIRLAMKVGGGSGREERTLQIDYSRTEVGVVAFERSLARARSRAPSLQCLDPRLQTSGPRPWSRTSTNELAVDQQESLNTFRVDRPAKP
jgi:hypothetical protein